MLKKIILFLFIFINSSYSHELRPSIANLNIYEEDNILNAKLLIQLNLESILAEIDFNHSDTDESKNSDKYKKLRNMSSNELTSQYDFEIKKLLNKIYLNSSEKNYDLILTNINIPEVGNQNVIRDTTVEFNIQNIQNENLKFYWDKKLGPIILRVNSVDNEDLYSAFVETDKKSDWFNPSFKAEENLIDNIKTYIEIGFTHILPKGLDHILFVLALFLLSSKFKPLILQVSLFTLSHTITLFLGALNIINISPQIVEPIIALSICFVAIENLFTDNLRKLRPYIIFMFGLLHGLGFAGIINEIGVSDSLFFVSLISFNVGVELGQIVVIILSYIFIALIFQKKKWYRDRVTKPLSVLIAFVGFYWFVQRIFF